MVRALIILLIVGAPAWADTVVFSNDFNSPTGFVDTTGVDVSQQNVNTLYGTAFQQVNTVETLHIVGPGAFVYSDPSGTGGAYSIGLLSNIQNDLLAITFDVTGFDFVNLNLDISSIDLNGVGGPFIPAGGQIPTFLLSLRDGTGFGGTLLDSASISGTISDKFVFDWTNHTVTLDTTGNTTGTVTLVVDLTAGGYASFDNLVINASNTAGQVTPIGGGTGGTVPEPGMLLLSGLAAAWIIRRRRRRA